MMNEAHIAAHCSLPALSLLVALSGIYLLGFGGVGQHPGPSKRALVIKKKEREREIRLVV